MFSHGLLFRRYLESFTAAHKHRECSFSRLPRASVEVVGMIMGITATACVQHPWKPLNSISVARGRRWRYHRAQRSFNINTLKTKLSLNLKLIATRDCLVYVASYAHGTFRQDKLHHPKLPPLPYKPTIQRLQGPKQGPQEP